MNHNAIYATHPNVVSVDDTAGAFDAQGNKVAIDEAAVAAEAVRLEAAAVIQRIEANRRAAYIAEADPLFFKAQRGEATTQEWQDKVAEIKARYPKEAA
jgi:hypothetical protein